MNKLWKQYDVVFISFLVIFFGLLIFCISKSPHMYWNKKDSSIKTPLDICIDSLKLASQRNDKNFRLSCHFEGFAIEAGQIDAVEMPELLDNDLL